MHPFLDGNGRMARLIATWLLYRHGFGVQQYISLERIIEDRKDDYYKALRLSDQGWHDGKHKVEPWVEFFANLVLDAYKIWDDRFNQTLKKKQKKKDLVRQEIITLKKFTFSTLCSSLPEVSKETIRMELTRMKNEQLIENSGRGRGSVWEVI